MTQPVRDVRLPEAQNDAFGRLRVAESHTIWESRMLWDNSPLLWDDQETSGGGTGSVFSSANARVRLSVSSATAGVRVRQTFRRFNYQPGKSQLMMATYYMGPPVAGVTKRVGLFDDNNGFYLEQSGSSFGFGLRSNISGTVVDTFIPQNEWSRVRGQPSVGGAHGKQVVSPEAANIFLLDYEWLGTGSVRYGFALHDAIEYYHEQHHANETTGVYIQTPNLPMRYEIRTDGTNTSAAFMDQLCNTIISEGGFHETGIVRSFMLETSKDATQSTSIYPIVGVRLKADKLDANVIFETANLLGEDTGNYNWYLLFNPDVASTSTLTVTNEANSAIQTLEGSSLNVLTSGTIIQSGFFTAGKTQTGSLVASPDILNAIQLGANIAGTPDEIWLGVKPHADGFGYRGSLTWREI